MNAHTFTSSPAWKANAARVEFITSTEPACRAHRECAAEDARDLSALATSTRSFLYGAVAKLRAMNHAKAGQADLALMGECVVDQLTETMTPEAARYFRAEFAALGGVGA